MKHGSYAMRCARCCFLKEWPEKWVDEREVCEPFDAEEISGYAKRIRALLGASE